MTRKEVWLALSALGASTVEISWAGGGDEGNIASVDIQDSKGETILDLEDPAAQAKYQDLYNTLTKPIDDYCDGNGDDSCATLIWDRKKKTVILSPSHTEWVDGDDVHIKE